MIFLFVAVALEIAVVDSISSSIVGNQDSALSGYRSSVADEAESRATCPVGYVVSHCEVQSGLVHTRGDGAYFDPSNDRVCEAVNGEGGPATIARAVCSKIEKTVTDPCNRGGPELPTFMNLHSRGIAPGVSCPLGYEQVLCNARSHWLDLLTNNWVNAKLGIIPNDRSCAVSKCATNNWCEVTAVCKFNEDSELYKTAACPKSDVVEAVGLISGSWDDAQSRAVCPTCYVVSHCEVQSGLVHTRSDGAYVDPSNGSVCVAVNGEGGPGVIARAVCSRNEQVTDPCNSGGPDLPKFINLHSRGSAPFVSCSPGYQQVLCNAMSPWLGLLTNKGVDTKGIIPNDRSCAVSECTTNNWCEVTAVCKMNEELQVYKTAVCSEKEIVGYRSTSADDAESKARCSAGYVVSHCEVQSGLVHTKSDGAYVDPSNGSVCVAVNGLGGLGVIARAVCSRSEQVADPCNSGGPDLPKFINLHSRGSAPFVSCSPGYQQVLCNAMSPWLGLLTNKGVDTKGIIPNDRSCAVSECTTNNWREVTAVCKMNEELQVYKTAVCSEKEIVGYRSTSADDAESKARCSAGYVVSHCEVQSGLVHTKSDGAYVDPSNGSVCVAVNGLGGLGVIARAVCSRSEQVTDPCNSGGPELPKFINLHSRGSAPIVSCPPGYQQVLCNAMSPWLGLLTNKGVDTKGIIPNDRSCAVSKCATNNWCEVTAVCKFNEDSELYKTAACPKSDVVEAVGLMSGSWDDAQSRAVCPTGYVVSHCEVQSGLVHTRNDGAYVDPSNGSVCVAVNGLGGPGVIARAVCSRNEQVADPCNSGGPDLPKFINLHSRGSAPFVSCPPGYQQVLCNAMSPWLGLLTNKGVNTKGIIPNDRSCAVSECTTNNWCEVTAVCKMNEELQVYKTAVCSEKEIVGYRSTSADDAESKARCSAGYVVSHCEVQSGLVHTKSDGAYVDPSNGSVCVAVNGLGGPGVIARAVCSRNEQVTDPCNSGGPELPKFINLHSRGQSPIVSCPPGYQQVLCNAMSPWLGLLTNKGVNTKGIIPNDRSCAVSGCYTTTWCEVTAVCKMNEDSELYKTAACPKSDVVEAVGLMSDLGDDAQSRVVCPTGYVVSHCEVQSGLVHTKSDGAYVDPSNGSVCVAVNGFGGPGVIARAVCSRNEQVTDPCNSGGPDLPKFINLHSRGSAPFVSCSPGYQQVLCNAMSPWLGLLTNKGVDTKGIIPNDRSCAVSGCYTTTWCEVTAVCKMNDGEFYMMEKCEKLYI